MQFYGPFSPLPATPGFWQINANAERLLVENDSVYDLYLFFGPDSPVARGGANVQGSYNIRIRSQKDAIIQLQRLGYGFGQNIFDGRVYYLLVLANPTSLTGDAITQNNIGLTSLDPGELIDQSVSAQRIVQLQGQPRVVSLPFAYDRTSTPSAAGASNQGLFTPAALNGNTDLFNIAGTFTSSTTVYGLAFYDVGFWPNGSANAGGLDFAIEVDLRNAGNASLGGHWPVVFVAAQVQWPATSAPPTPYTLPSSLAVRYVGIPGNASADHLTVMVHTNGISNSVSIRYDIGYSLAPGVPALLGSYPLPGIYGITTAPVLY